MTSYLTSWPGVALSIAVCICSAAISDRVLGQTESEPANARDLVHALLTLHVNTGEKCRTDLDISTEKHSQTDLRCNLRIPFGISKSDRNDTSAALYGLRAELDEQTNLDRRPELRRILLSFDVPRLTITEHVKLEAEPWYYDVPTRAAREQFSDDMNQGTPYPNREPFDSTRGLRNLANRNNNLPPTAQAPWNGSPIARGTVAPFAGESNYFVIEKRDLRWKIRFMMTALSPNEVLPEEVHFEFADRFAIIHSNASLKYGKVDKQNRIVSVPREFFESGNSLYVEYQPVFSKDAARTFVFTLLLLVGVIFALGPVAEPDFVPYRKFRIALVLGVSAVVVAIAIAMWTFPREPLLTDFQCATIVLVMLIILVLFTFFELRRSSAVKTNETKRRIESGVPTQDPPESERDSMKRQDLSIGHASSHEDAAPQYSETVNVEPVEGKLKILFLAANPEGTTQLKLQEEFRNIQDRIREAEFRDRIELVIRPAARWSDLSLALLQEKPHVVHFSGHGSDRDELILQDSQGKAHTISRKAIVELFKTLKDDIRLVVFNACYSEPQAKGVVENIAFAIGMSQAISDDAAIQFAESLYRAIGFGRTLEEAFKLGVIDLQVARIGEELTPRILSHPLADASQTRLIKIGIDQANKPLAESTQANQASGAVVIWREKLERLQNALALEDDPTRMLRYEKQIEECEQKIKELT